jgi:hypothetical protein
VTAAPEPTRQVRLYAGTAGHSAWFSEDLGESWVHPNSHSGMYLETRVWCFASHSSTPERLFAGTDMGAFRWDEETARWTSLPSPIEDVWAINVHPANPDVLIAGTRPAAFGSVRGCGGNSGFGRGVGLGWPSELAARMELRRSHP